MTVITMIFFWHLNHYLHWLTLFGKSFLLVKHPLITSFIFGKSVLNPISLLMFTAIKELNSFFSFNLYKVIILCKTFYPFIVIYSIKTHISINCIFFSWYLKGTNLKRRNHDTTNWCIDTINYLICLKYINKSRSSINLKCQDITNVGYSAASSYMYTLYVFLFFNFIYLIFTEQQKHLTVYVADSCTVF